MKSARMVVLTLVATTVIGCRTEPSRGSLSGDREPAAAPLPSSPSHETASGSRPTGTDGDPAEGGRGPTLLLSYAKEAIQLNPINCFTYFAPLTAPVAVARTASADNQQRSGIFSYTCQATSTSFQVTCEFEMVGKGFERYTFDPAAMLAMHEAGTRKGAPLANVLDYISFEGEGFGTVQVRGTTDGAAELVTEVELRFNGRGRESPVTVGIYTVACKNGRYEYQNRSDELVARVNTLTFTRSDNPGMDISVASVTRKAERSGFVARLRAAAANLFIKPAAVDQLGNETVLDFGRALLKREPAFTFPRASHLKQGK